MSQPSALSSTSSDRLAGWLAVACCLAAMLGLAALLPEYTHAQHPLGMLGAAGIPRAMLFNVIGFVVPGLLAAWIFVRLRGRLPQLAGSVAGIGCWMLTISALAFAAQGIWRLDPADLDGPVSQRHATAWLLWWLAFAAGAFLLGFGLRHEVTWRRVTVAFFTAGVLAIVLNALPSAVLVGPIAQRALLLVWLACVVIASRSR